MDQLNTSDWLEWEGGTTPYGQILPLECAILIVLLCPWDMNNDKEGRGSVLNQGYFLFSLSHTQHTSH